MSVMHFHIFTPFGILEGFKKNNFSTLFRLFKGFKMGKKLFSVSNTSYTALLTTI